MSTRDDNFLARCLEQLGWSAERLAREVNRVHGAGSISAKAPYGWLKGAKPRGVLPVVVVRILTENLEKPISIKDLWPDKELPQLSPSEMEYHVTGPNDDKQLTTESVNSNTVVPKRFSHDSLKVSITPTLLWGDNGFPQGNTSSADRRLAVLDILNALSDTHFPEGILFHIDSVERFLQEMCRINLRRLLEFQGASRATHLIGDAVCFGDLTMVIKIQPDIEQNRTLRIVLQDPVSPQLDTNSFYLHQIISISDSMGYYDTLRLSVPRSLSSEIVESIRICAEDIFCAGYFWLQKNYRRDLISLGTQFEHECLELFRWQLFAYNYDNFKDHIWVTTITNGRAYYALDEQVVDLAIAKAKKNNTLQQPPTAVVSSLLVNSVSFDKSFSEIAIRENRVITMDMGNAPYAEVAHDLAASQHVIYNPYTNLAPLISHQNASLSAAYPPELHTEFSKFFDNPDSYLDTYVRSTSLPTQSAEIRVSGM